MSNLPAEPPYSEAPIPFPYYVQPDPVELAIQEEFDLELNTEHIKSLMIATGGAYLAFNGLHDLRALSEISSGTVMDYFMALGSLGLGATIGWMGTSKFLDAYINQNQKDDSND